MSRSRLLAPAVAVLAWLGAMMIIAPRAPAQVLECDSAQGPDVVVADLPVVKKWGSVNLITGYSIGSNAVNVGDESLQWINSTNRHPVIAMNAYRLRNGRFEQIGMSWLKHGFTSTNSQVFCNCADPDTGSLLGPGCNDAYSSHLNGLQGGLGPRSEINPVTGEFLYPFSTQGEVGDSIYKRLQIRNADLNPAVNEGALYFAELHYIAPDDAEAGNDLNNASYMPIQVQDFVDGGYDLSYTGPPRVGLPAIYAWREVDPEVTITSVNVPGDGRFYVASKVSDLGNGQWQYEYAVHNYHSHRAAREFRIPVPAGVQVTSINFTDVDYHSGEPFDGTDWSADLAGGELTWSGPVFAEGPNGNALRWGTLYNFRFRADVPPTLASASIGLFRPGGNDAVSLAVPGPAEPLGGGGPPNDDCADAADIGLGATAFTTIGATTDGPAFPCSPTAQHDVWFRFAPSFTGRVRISTCGAANFNTVLDVYEGCGCEAASSPPVRCNDSGCGGAAKVVLTVQAGACYLIRLGGVGGESGSGTLTLALLDDNNAASAARIITGQHAGDRLGQSVAGAGDVDGDGSRDVLIGSMLHDGNGANAGEMCVHLGQAFGIDVSFFGDEPGDQLGRAVAGGCDFNHDGFDDMLVASPFNDDHGSQAGKVLCFSGFDNSLMWLARGQLPGDRFGWSVACVGDMNEDGVDDVLVGAPRNDIAGNNVGRAYLLAGQDGSIFEIFTGNVAWGAAEFGSAVAALGDANGDGVNDFAIAAPRSDFAGTDSGRVTVYSGATKKPLQAISGSPGERLGSALAGWTGNIGAQTRTYLAMGAPNAGGGAGLVRLHMRNHAAPACGTLLCTAHMLHGEAAGDRFGAALALDDLVMGAVPDVLVGAPDSDANGSGSGAAFIFNGGNGALVRRITGETAGDALGTSVAAAGDLDHDGRGDILLGAPLNDAGAPNAGRAYIFFSDENKSLRAQGQNADDDGDGFAADGDVNADGAIDADDLIEVILHWGHCHAEDDCPADIDDDGEVNVSDLLVVMASESSRM